MSKTYLVPTDINDPATGEPLYVTVTPHCRLYWIFKWCFLFCGIVWRESPTGVGRMSIGCSAAVCNVVYGKEIRAGRNQWKGEKEV